MEFFGVQTVDIITSKAKTFQLFGKFLHRDFTNAGEPFIILVGFFTDNLAVEVVAVSVLIDSEITFRPLPEVVRHIPEVFTEYDISHLWFYFYGKGGNGEIKTDALKDKIYIGFPFSLSVVASEQVFIKVRPDLSGFEVVVIFGSLVVVIGEHNEKHTADA